MNVSTSHHAPRVDNFQPTVGLTIIAVMATAYLLARRSRNQPPGPWVILPGIGHLLRFAKDPVEQLRSLRKQYGDVFKVYMGTMPVVFINGSQVVNNVLHMRGAEFAHRPQTFIADRLADHKGFLNTSGHVWTEQKQNIVKTLRQLTATGGLLEHYTDSALTKLADHLTSLLQRGEGRQVDIAPVLKRSVCSIAFAMAYGRELDLHSDLLTSYTETIEQFLSCLNLAVMTTFIPFIHLLPRDPVGYRKCKQLSQMIENDFVRPELERISKLYATRQTSQGIKGNNPDCDVSTYTLCLAGAYIEEMNEKRRNDRSTLLSGEHLPKTISEVILGSLDTMSQTLEWFLIYMTHHQEVQKRCRREIMALLGNGSFSMSCIDRSHLAYTQATIMEVQRHANIVPMPPCHTSDKDTYINGYFIPKNTAIITNMDSLMMGPEVGDDPHEFRPERFLTADGRPFYPRWFMPFLTGKRMCPGVSIAKKELLGLVVGLLSKFHFSAPVVAGIETLPSLVGVVGLTKVPLPFKLCVQSV